MGLDDMKEKAGDAAEQKAGGTGSDQLDKAEKTADEKIGE